MNNQLYFIIIVLLCILVMVATLVSQNRPISDSDRKSGEVTDLLRKNGYLD